MTNSSAAESFETRIPDVPPMEALKECATLLANMRSGGEPLPITEGVIFSALADGGRVTVIEAELAANELIGFVYDQEFELCKRYSDSEQTEEGLWRTVERLKHLRMLRGLAILLLPGPDVVAC